MADSKDPEALAEQSKALAEEVASKRNQVDENVAVMNARRNCIKGAEVVGDPVQISTGSYLVNYLDFKAKDNLTKFEVHRKYSYSHLPESFGYGWICPLDSRIIRNRPDDIPDCLADIEKGIEYCQQAMDSATKYITKYGEDFPSESITAAYEKMKAQKEKYESLKSGLLALQAENNKIDELNAFVTYGNYSEKKDFRGGKEQLIFLNENGDSILFHYTGAGQWTPYEASAACVIQLFGLNPDGSRADSYFSEGGYQLIFASGDQIFYSKYGLLVKKICPNGNVTLYDCGLKREGSIKLATGEVLSVKRNSRNFIEKIEGPVSGSAEYSYSGDKLTSVRDNEGVLVRFSFDQNNNLTAMIKADGKAVSLLYEYNSGLQKNVCTRVTDEEGNSEYFSYNTASKEVSHKNSDGGMELYRYNSDGVTVYQKLADGKEIFYYPDSRGLIEKSRENGYTKQFFYDTSLRLTGILYEGGARESCYYNSLGKITKTVDGDGFSNQWEYDSRGNLTVSYYNETKISSCSYYPSGLLKSLEEGGIKKEFFYNQFGFVTSKKTFSEGKCLTESWEYDSKCRVSKYTDQAGRVTKISYPDLFSRVEVYGDFKKIERHFNERLFECVTVETDLKSGISYKKQTFYDGRGNPIEIFINGQKISSYEYMPSKKLKSYTVWNLNEGGESAKQGIKTEYIYDSGGRLLKEKRSVVNDGKGGRKALVEGDALICSCAYSRNGKGETVSVARGGKTITYNYNARGFLIKEVHPDGFYKSYSYTAGGRLESIRDSNLNYYRRNYYRDGSFSESHQNKFQNTKMLVFNEKARLTLCRDFMGNESSRKYDAAGNLVRETGPLFVKSYYYDEFSRLKGFSFKDNEGEVYLEGAAAYNDRENSAEFSLGGKKSKSLFYDCWNRPVKIITASGSCELEYDSLGNCRKMSDKNQELYQEYSPFGELSFQLIKNTAGGEEIFRLEREVNAFGNCLSEKSNGRNAFSGKYDVFGRVEELTDQFGNKCMYEYKPNGSLKAVDSYSGGKTSFSKEGENNFKVLNADKSFFEYEVNTFGKIVREESPLKKSRFFEYDKNGNLTEEKLFSGKRQFIERNYTDGSCSVTFSDGKKHYIKRNPAGALTKIQNDFSSIEYEYDRGGRLTKFYDLINDIEISYDYDDFGRCLSKRGKSFDFSYLYDESGKLKEISEATSGFWVRFTYDDLNREIFRKYSNGLVLKTGFNQKGQKCFFEARDSLNNLIHADYIIYDDKNRIQFICDRDLNIRKFSYDSKGRLQTASYPYNDQHLALGIREGLECGLYLKTEAPDGKNLYFESSEISKINEVLRQAGNMKAISGQQYSWEEEYEYTESGAVKSVKNPLGKINYEYDALGRLQKKYAASSKGEGMTFEWNDDNCLEKISGPYTQISISYGAMERPVKITSYDSRAKKYSSFEFAYDALGRRIYEKSGAGLGNYFLYDGCGNNILMRTSLRENGLSQLSGLYSAQNESLPSFESADFSEAGSVRTGNFSAWLSSTRTMNQYDFEKEELPSLEKAVTASAYSPDNDYSEPDIRSCVFLNIGKTSSVLLYSNKEVEVAVSDYTGNNCAVFSSDSNCSCIMDYDIWGNPLQSGKLESYSNSKGKNEAGLLFYNLGARDYCPEIKCFTSMDCARDGSSWFAYCACDPLNYKDSSGLKKKSASELENYDYEMAIISLAVGFSLLDYSAEGDSYFIPGSCDCADVSAVMDYLAANMAGLENYSSRASEFAELYSSGDLKGALASICSSDFFNGNNIDSLINTSKGFDRDALKNYVNYFSKNGEYENVSAYISQMRSMADAISALSNPNFVSPGTVLVWSKSDTPAPGSPKSWQGHTLTVVARTFDSRGYVTGFAYIEGHTGGNQTKIGYMNISKDSNIPDYDGNVYHIDSWYGDYKGTYEFDSTDALDGGGCGK